APEVEAGAAAGGGDLTAPLPGVVLALRAEPGARVTAGQTVLVLESMKMELDVAAPHDGTLAAVHVAPGEPVARGQALAVVEEDA
ncbi:acetyl-CoA carboxylase biotin carboxyl carrier protein subunit, partial [Patulibacter sp. S7RM1-6]